MSKLNRRQWLKSSSSLIGAATLLSGFPSFANSIVGDQINEERTLIRLSSNENPYGPSKVVRQKIIDSFDESCRYPWAYMQPLKEKLAEREGVSSDCIVITGGSTEGLKAAGAVYGMYGGNIIAPKPTFLAMMDYSLLFGSNVTYVDVDANMGVDLQSMKNSITPQTNLIFLCNPNNPTSTLLPSGDLRQFCNEISKDVIVFSDEAYYDFIEEEGYPSMVELVKENKNVIVSRTFSKVYGLAGLRIGYLIARPDIARRLRDHIMAFTNVPALRAAEAALDDHDFYQMSLKKNRESKEMIYNTLDKLDMRYVKSHTNFVFFESGKEIDQLGKHFYEKGILIGRPFPPFNKWCRISTGTIEQTDRFCAELRSLYS
ncbi:pyridoxal phosphate-dependent aminotransferase [Marinigracilibium pacificum]|uniref:histidinol-phosphate transaminase n=1 Tax=Marinigracilibium pacificum TaxID=2729599 RepID=A0A848J2R2_9BACT|nr:histidinol-phosphate transaminase [Marinigracilibium pacificum]NMM50887.1 histidinol-phosphate aminotransferase family protein [Marinigracilibium pacificum]